MKQIKCSKSLNIIINSYEGIKKLDIKLIPKLENIYCYKDKLKIAILIEPQYYIMYKLDNSLMEISRLIHKELKISYPGYDIQIKCYCAK